MTFGAFWIFQLSSPAVLLLDLGVIYSIFCGSARKFSGWLAGSSRKISNYCGGEKKLSPPRFQHYGGERPHCPPAVPTPLSSSSSSSSSSSYSDFSIVVLHCGCRCVVWKVLDACKFMGNGTLLASPRCDNNGNCENGSRSDSPGSFSCNCAVGYTGQYCQQSMTINLSVIYSPFCYTYDSSGNVVSSPRYWSRDR